jgi:hypothetical protein
MLFTKQNPPAASIVHIIINNQLANQEALGSFSAANQIAAL